MTVRPPAPFAGATALAILFTAIAIYFLPVLPWEYDEGTFILGARLIQRGLRPFADFAVHQPPLHLYLLNLSGDLFGHTFFGYRMLSVVSVALSGMLLFALIRPFAGSVAALVGEAIFLFSPSQLHSLSAVGEPVMLFFCLLGAVLLFVGTSRASTYASALAFVAALLVKPICLLMIAAAVLSLIYGRAWRRLADFAVAGLIGGALGVAWTFVLSDGIFTDVLRYTAQRVGSRKAGLWDIDSGFADLRILLGIETRAQWTWFCFKNFWYFPEHYTPAALFALAFAALPIWLLRCARQHKALAAFTLLWPLSWLATNFLALDYVSAKYFVPFLAFAAFLLASLVWLAQQYVATRWVTLAGGILGLALAVQLTRSLAMQVDPWFYDHAQWLVQQFPRTISFSPMIYATTGVEPECGLWNAPDTYGGFGDAILGASERMRRFRVTDDMIIDCLRKNPDVFLVIDYWYYFFSRPNGALRAYLAGEGLGRGLFFSPEAEAQWNEPRLTTGAYSR